MCTDQAEIWHGTYWAAQQWENTRGEAPAKIFLDRSNVVPGFPSSPEAADAPLDFLASRITNLVIPGVQ